MKRRLYAFTIAIVFVISLISMGATAATPIMTGTLSNGKLTITVTNLDSKVQQVEFLAVSETDSSDFWFDTAEVSNETASMTFTVTGNDYTVNATTLASDSSGIVEAQLNSIEVKKSTTQSSSSSTQPSSSVPTTSSSAVTKPIGVTYSAHVQKIGWQAAASNGAMAGTTGKSLRIEGLKISLTGTLPKGAAITYKAYVQSIGWQNAVSNGTMIGTTGQSLRIEALKITISGLTGHAVKYRAYVQKTGWQNWQTTQNGTSVSSAPIAGTTGKSLRIEAVEIVIS